MRKPPPSATWGRSGTGAVFGLAFRDADLRARDLVGRADWHRALVPVGRHSEPNGKGRSPPAAGLPASSAVPALLSGEGCNTWAVDNDAPELEVNECRSLSIELAHAVWPTCSWTELSWQLGPSVVPTWRRQRTPRWPR